jgi:hypothetical protein
MKTHIDINVFSIDFVGYQTIDFLHYLHIQEKKTILLFNCYAKFYMVMLCVGVVEKFVKLFFSMRPNCKDVILKSTPLIKFKRVGV